MMRFFIGFVLCSLLIGVPPALVGYFYGTHLLSPHFNFMFAFFCMVTFITCYLVLIGQRYNNTMGAQLFLAATVVKLLACMAFAIAYLLKYTANATIFVSSFFYLYFSFTVFEVYSLLTNLRVQNKKEKT